MPDQAAPDDPRLERPTPEGGQDIRPVVRRPGQGASGGMIAVGAIAAGLLLFGVLDARRRSLSAPTIRPQATEVAQSAAPPPLYIPPEPTPSPPPAVEAAPVTPAAPAMPMMPALPPAPPPHTYIPAPPQIVAPPAAPPRNASGAAVVLDNTAGGSAPSATGGTVSPVQPATLGASTDRARAGAFANRATTVPQGTLIPAVLETAFDSTRGGFARALVQRDIHGFDGTRVLIPRGSRLIGEYRGDAAPGQKRALINWTRLIRPDGATIAIGSPAADSVGRNGVRAKVNSHFLERFAGAILQSALDVGVNLAAQSSGSTTVVALPGAFQGTSGALVRPTQIPPTLSVAPGTSISVFVARDLDFSDTEGGE